MNFDNIRDEKRKQNLASMKRIKAFCEESIDHEESWATFKKCLQGLLEKEDRMLKMLFIYGNDHKP